MKQKTLLLLTEYWCPQLGGIQRYLLGIMQHLRGWQKIVVAPREKDDGNCAGEGIELIRKRFYWPFIKPAWLFLYFFIGNLIRRREVSLLLCGKSLFEGLLAYYLKKRTGQPYLVFTYAMEIEEWLRNPRTKRKLKRVLDAADGITYINRITRQRLQDELDISPDKFSFLPPAVDPFFAVSVSPEEQTAIQEKYDIKPPYIISVGRLIPRKGFDMVLDAFGGLEQTKWSDVSLVIVGDGPEKHTLETQARQLFLNDERQQGRVKFIGSVGDKDLRGLLAGSSLFALAPRELTADMEGFGIVFLEAAMAGKPTVGTKSGGIVEAVLDEKTGILVPENDGPAMTSAFERLLEDEVLAGRLGQAGRKRVQQEFTWQKQIDTFEQILDKALS